MRIFESRPRRLGFTFLEVIIAAVILALAFFPIMRVVDFGGVSTVKINNSSKAARLAQELIEECKHVPFRVYQTNPNYAGLADGASFDIQPDYYQKTRKSIEEFRDANKQSLKDFAYLAKLKIKKNGVNQIKEIWFEVEISWREKGKKDDTTQPLRKVRAGNAAYNAEAI